MQSIRHLTNHRKFASYCVFKYNDKMTIPYRIHWTPKNLILNFQECRWSKPDIKFDWTTSTCIVHNEPIKFPIEPHEAEFCYETLIGYPGPIYNRNNQNIYVMTNEVVRTEHLKDYYKPYSYHKVVPLKFETKLSHYFDEYTSDGYQVGTIIVKIKNKEIIC